VIIRHMWNFQNRGITWRRAALSPAFFNNIALSIHIGSGKPRLLYRQGVLVLCQRRTESASGGDTSQHSMGACVRWMSTGT
jgi:hypothetical protein